MTIQDYLMLKVSITFIIYCSVPNRVSSRSGGEYVDD